jgi:6-pyruvoyltetrahydropterin/6-carboxytetrahydropterin synthase
MHRLVHTIRFESARKLTKVPKDHPCSNLYGLAFKLEIHIEGTVNPETGFVVDFNDLENAAFGRIKEQLDHNYLNDIKHLENPTSENLIEWIWNELHDQFSMSWNGSQSDGFKSKLVKLVLWENEVSRVEFSGN